MKKLLFVLVAAVLSGCSGGEHGEATLWITRDRGAHMLLQRQVPAGLTAMQALDRVADIKTRYAGRFVQSINGLSGSLSARRDWFYFINGYEADRSAAEYRLHDGDVEWWDYRSWNRRMRAPIVVGAFPEPFLHGFDGKRLPAVVVDTFCLQRAASRRLARMLHARTVCRARGPLRGRENMLVLMPAPRVRLFDASQWQGDGPGDPVRFRFIGPAERLADDPQLARFRYSVVP